ncbi:iron chelate uptake ABC transporter family permease subunit [Agromyces sp. NBRC 114283]|uniref:FecCD family ABC transporter permease n=1 Tax=Agromyces sp. NBRC 114283 TaxID=2994521 RepID=UPI0024A314FB|nr:iron chelate uptake ABC transporter family permease subunit [Agromyces sp. NBRC 114283]GLU90904.1 iron-enterobactin transporter permease [Agromyces sp. NBRC 114283]
MSVQAPPRAVVLRSAGGGFGIRFGVRHALVVAALLAAALAVGVVSLGTGDFVVPLGDVVGALLGQGDRRTNLVVLDWRLPRVLLALMLGAALGAAGAIFQSITRNPLGSPDVIGFDTGAYTGGLLVIITTGTGYLATASGALLGGFATAVVVYLLAYRRGFHGFRLIIVGIGVAAMLASLNTWLILSAELNVALAAAAWSSGSLNAVGWAQAVPAAAVLLVLWAVAAAMSRRLHLLELGDDAATALGVRTGRARLVLVVLGVALTATSVAAAGPIAFVALAAPQLARRLSRSAGVTLAGAAAMGALLLTASDYAAQRLFAPTQLPVGVVTVSVGGVYLIWLLITEARRR